MKDQEKAAEEAANTRAELFSEYLQARKEQAGAEQEEGGAHALAAAVEDVLAGFLDERHVGSQALAEQTVGRRQLVRDERDEPFGLTGVRGCRGVEQFMWQARWSGLADGGPIQR